MGAGGKMAPNTGGPPLWSALSIPEIKELIKFSAGELARCYALKEREQLLQYSYNARLEKEIDFFERAQDSHWGWLRARTREVDPFGTGQTDQARQPS
jgi:hypothetical protein